MQSNIFRTAIIISLIGLPSVYSINFTKTHNLRTNCNKEDLNSSLFLEYRYKIDANVARLKLGDNCTLDDKVITYQNTLEISHAKADLHDTFEWPQLSSICDALHDIAEDPELLICNSTALLYCKPLTGHNINAEDSDANGVCSCLENFEEDNYGIKEIKPKTCVLKGGDACGPSWERNELNILQGFPVDSPECDSHRCVEDAQTSISICTDDEVGLTLLMVLKDKVGFITSYSLRQSLSLHNLLRCLTVSVTVSQYFSLFSYL